MNDYSEFYESESFYGNSFALSLENDLLPGLTITLTPPANEKVVNRVWLTSSPRNNNDGSENAADTKATTL